MTLSVTSNMVISIEFHNHISLVNHSKLQADTRLETPQCFCFCNTNSSLLILYYCNTNQRGQRFSGSKAVRPHCAHNWNPSESKVKRIPWQAAWWSQDWSQFWAFLLSGDKTSVCAQWNHGATNQCQTTKRVHEPQNQS